MMQLEGDLQAKIQWTKCPDYHANLSKLIEYFSGVPDLEVFPEETCYGTETADPRIPKSVKQALLGPEAEHWAEAIKYEMDSIEHHETYSSETLPLGKKTLCCGLILRIKPADDGKPRWKT
jgi:hypothetical protein